jgi:hypothetical protein
MDLIGKDQHCQKMVQVLTDKREEGSTLSEDGSSSDREQLETPNTVRSELKQIWNNECIYTIK